MARIRTIKPEFWADEKLSAVDPVTRLVFLGLISLADDRGRLVDSIKLLDGQLFPHTDDSCSGALETLASISRVLRYTSASGQKLIQIVNWEKHQKVDKPAKYSLPAPSAEQITQASAPERVTPKIVRPSRTSRERVARKSREPRAPTYDLRPTTNDQGAKSSASGEAVPRTTGLDVLSKADCDQLFETWTSRRGGVAYGRFRKTILLLFQSELTRYTTAEIDNAIIAFAEWVEEQPDKEQGFCTLDRFISEIAKWVRFGKMPYVSNGEMTERGQWAGSRELREEALAKRSA